jgi:hypothetical protein
MKKVIFVLFFYVVSFGVNAQTSTPGFVEVKGVETRWEKYKGDDNKTEYWGVTFSNKNAFPVTVEVEVWYNTGSAFERFTPSQSSRIANTKSFMLQKDESYLWKLGLDYYQGYSGGSRSSSNDYYVKFKAYR